jgi:GNAT superfamily N-acetyltransferase
VIKAVAAHQLPALADLLVRAFDDDPLSNFIFGGDRRRHRGLHSFFTAQIRHQYLPLGEVFTTEGLGGVAVWGPPSRLRHPAKELLELVPTAPFLVGKNMVRSLRLLMEVDALHPREPHWYLATLATEPRLQGTGVGSALLATMLARVDEEGMPAYLESSKARNVPLYARYGFEVIEEFHSKVGSPPMWRMWREPRPPET